MWSAGSVPAFFLGRVVHPRSPLIPSLPVRSTCFHPVIRPLSGDWQPLAALRRLACWLPGTLLFHSGGASSERGRYSFLTADPVEWFTLAAPPAGNLAGQSRWAGAASPLDGAPLELLDQRLTRFATAAVPGLPPFQGGWAGLLGYGLGDCFERLPRPGRDWLQVPALQLGLYDFCLAWDHWLGTVHLISQGLPETDPDRRQARAEARADEILSGLERAGGNRSGTTGAPDSSAEPLGSEADADKPADPPAAPDWMRLLDPARPLYSNFSRAEYLAAIRRCVDWIHAGDAFQINLAQQLWTPATVPDIELLSAMHQQNAAPFSAWMDLGRIRLVSASPERLFSLREGWLESRPIKGTRSRDLEDPQRDQRLARELLESDKDHAENTMIVDLLRNDLSRFCRDESVQVTQWCGLESYSRVHHLVSVIRGQVLPGVPASRILAAMFPGGSVTGAPRIRAMEIISELERDARGAYCGSLGYFGLDGSADFSILIRTVTGFAGWWQFPVGGGIVADSDPEAELAETWTKAEGLLRAMDTVSGKERR